MGLPRERMSPIGAVAGGLILSGILSFFLLFLIHIYAAIFFLVFLMAFMVYFLYEPKLKPGVSVVMSATPSRKVYDLGNPKGSYEEKKLKKADFIVTENYNIRLRENTAKALIEKIKLNFNARALYKGKYYSYQSILYENVRLLANYIIGKSGKLQFNILEFKINRTDNTAGFAIR